MTSLLETRERSGELATHDTAELLDMVSIRREALSMVRLGRLNQNDVDDYCQSVACNVLQRCGSVTSKERYRWSLRWSHSDALREMRRQNGMHPAELSDDATEDARTPELTRAERQEAYRLELIERGQTFNRLTLRGYYNLASIANDCPSWLLSLLPGVADVMDALPDRRGSLPADWYRVYPGSPAQSMEEMMDRRPEPTV